MVKLEAGLFRWWKGRKVGWGGVEWGGVGWASLYSLGWSFCAELLLPIGKRIADPIVSGRRENKVGRD